jgi:hypothetical protein
VIRENKIDKYVNGLESEVFLPDIDWKALNQLGDEGWELVLKTDWEKISRGGSEPFLQYIFKRPKP